MKPLAIRVRALPDGNGFEVERESAAFGRRSIGFRLHARDANQLAREHHEIGRAFYVPGTMSPPVLELFED